MMLERIKGLPQQSRDVLLNDLLALQARDDLLCFLDFVFIPDPPPAGTGIIKFEKWAHIMRLHAAVEAVRPGGTLPNLKARKIGITSYFEARDVWTALYQSGAFLPVISQGEKEARKVIADCKFIWENLPDSMRPDLVTENLETLKFKGGGTIEAFPSTSKAGRSYTGTEILFDEADFHEGFSTSYDALLPLIQDTGGKMFLISTANPEKVDSEFRQVYLRAENRIFLGYYERPNRTEKTYEAAKSLASDQANFEKENPRTEEEALAPPRALAYFDPDKLQYMMDNDVMEPIGGSGGLSIWKEAGVGRRYVLGADAAWGKTGSYTVASVEEWGTYEQVAELRGRIHPNDAAFEIWELHKRYNHAYIGIERAGEGQERDGDAVVVVDKVVKLLEDCPCEGRLYYHDRLSSTPVRPGWITDGQSRTPMLGLFKETVREGHSKIRSRVGVAEMMTFVKTEQGRPEASKGAYDDCVMCYAITRKMHELAEFMGQIRTAVMPSFS